MLLGYRVMGNDLLSTLLGNARDITLSRNRSRRRHLQILHGYKRISEDDFRYLKIFAAILRDLLVSSDIHGHLQVFLGISGCRPCINKIFTIRISYAEWLLPSPGIHQAMPGGAVYRLPASAAQEARDRNILYLSEMKWIGCTHSQAPPHDQWDREVKLLYLFKNTFSPLIKFPTPITTFPQTPLIKSASITPQRKHSP